MAKKPFKPTEGIQSQKNQRSYRTVNISADIQTELSKTLAAQERYYPFKEGCLHALDQLCDSLGGPMRIASAHCAAASSERRGLDNIVCMYVGKKSENGRPTPDDAVVVQVAKKYRNRTDIGSEAQIPKTITVGGVEYKTDVEEVGVILAQSLPVKPGSRIQLDGVNFWGTFGCLCAVPDGDTHALCILSNNHVLADTNRAALDSLIVGENEYIGRLYDFKQMQLRNSPGANPQEPAASLFNWVDGALAVTNPDLSIVSPGADPVVATPGSPDVGRAVKKYGGRTGYTTGQIKSNTGRIWAGYDPDPMGNARTIGYFVDQIVIKDDSGNLFSDHGDSGSAILDLHTNEVLGLLFAGVGNNTYANPIDKVVEAFNIAFFVDSF